MVLAGSDEQNLAEQIKKWIESSGAGLEMRVAQIMIRRGLTVQQSLYYTDPETDLSREIDVVARREVQIDERRRVGAYLTIECKYARTPWVLFRSEPGYASATQNLDRITTRYGAEWLTVACEHPAVANAMDLPQFREGMHYEE